MPNPIILTRTYDDTDAIAYLAALTSAGITPSATQIQAAHFFAKACKWANIWTKFTAVYPFIGGTAATHAVNMKTPGTYTITWNGTVTHNSNGITGNGSNGYGDTGLNANTVLTLNSNHVSVYSRTNSSVTSTDIGCWDTGPSKRIEIYSRYTDGLLYTANGSGTESSATVPDSFGITIASRTTSSLMGMYRKGMKLKAPTTASTALAGYNIYISAVNAIGSATNYSSRNLAFASIGSGLSDTDATNLSSIVQSLQTILGRAV